VSLAVLVSVGARSVVAVLADVGNGVTHAGTIPATCAIDVIFLVVVVAVDGTIFVIVAAVANGIGALVADN
jgi:hypothetical protein